jgi:hypothetical protein
MSLEGSGQKLVESVERLRPARLVKGVSFFRGERALLEDEPRPISVLQERERHNGDLVVGI